MLVAGVGVGTVVALEMVDSVSGFLDRKSGGEERRGHKGKVGEGEAGRGERGRDEGGEVRLHCMYIGMHGEGNIQHNEQRWRCVACGC